MSCAHYAFMVMHQLPLAWPAESLRSIKPQNSWFC